MIGKREEIKKQVSFRLTEDEYKEFNKACHLEFSQMASIVRGLVLDWMEKKRKKGK